MIHVGETVFKYRDFKIRSVPDRLKTGSVCASHMTVKRKDDFHDDSATNVVRFYTDTRLYETLCLWLILIDTSSC